MTVKLLTEQYLEFLSLTGGCTGCSESTLVKIPHCWKSHVMAHLICWFCHVMTHFSPKHVDDTQKNHLEDRSLVLMDDKTFWGVGDIFLLLDIKINVIYSPNIHLYINWNAVKLLQNKLSLLQEMIWTQRLYKNSCSTEHENSTVHGKNAGK